MKNRLYFKNVTKWGDLFLDHIFYEFEKEPILFTCVDKEMNIVLCLCSEIRFQQKWLLSKCSVETLRAMIDRKEDVFIQCNEIDAYHYLWTKQLQADQQSSYEIVSSSLSFNYSVPTMDDLSERLTLSKKPKNDITEFYIDLKKGVCIERTNHTSKSEINCNWQTNHFYAYCVGSEKSCKNLNITCA